jgi:HAD superfamily hydrolase (TIGR01509 family)
MSGKRPAAIIFDLAEVLCRGLPGAEVALAEVFSVPPETVLPGLRGPIMNDYCRGRMTEPEFWERTCAKCSWRGDLAKAHAALLRNMEVKLPGTEAVLRELAGAGHRTYLLSDHGREWIDHLLGVHGFMGVFRRRFFSFEHGSIKTEPAAFAHVLEELGSPPPGEVLFIDDAEENVATARAAGLDAIRFAGAGPLRGELASRGLTSSMATWLNG